MGPNAASAARMGGTRKMSVASTMLGADNEQSFQAVSSSERHHQQLAGRQNADGQTERRGTNGDMHAAGGTDRNVDDNGLKRTDVRVQTQFSIKGNGGMRVMSSSSSSPSLSSRNRQISVGNERPSSGVGGYDEGVLASTPLLYGSFLSNELDKEDTSPPETMGGRGHGRGRVLGGSDDDEDDDDDVARDDNVGRRAQEDGVAGSSYDSDLGNFGNGVYSDGGRSFLGRGSAETDAGTKNISMEHETSSTTREGDSRPTVFGQSAGAAPRPAMSLLSIDVDKVRRDEDRTEKPATLSPRRKASDGTTLRMRHMSLPPAFNEHGVKNADDAPPAEVEEEVEDGHSEHHPLDVSPATSASPVDDDAASVAAVAAAVQSESTAKSKEAATNDDAGSRPGAASSPLTAHSRSVRDGKTAFPATKAIVAPLVRTISARRGLKAAVLAPRDETGVPRGRLVLQRLHGTGPKPELVAAPGPSPSPSLVSSDRAQAPSRGGNASTNVNPVINELNRRNSSLVVESAQVQLLRSSMNFINDVVREMLTSEGLHVETWLEVVESLAQSASQHLRSGLLAGMNTGFDPRYYIKVKCIPETGSTAASSRLLCGLCCRKNVTHRKMRRSISRPKVMLLLGALEYHRTDEIRLTSLDSIIDQEAYYLRLAVAKVAALKPDILMVEKSVARHAQQLLLDEGITLVLNVKRSLLERASRLTGATVAPALDNLQDVSLGECESFHLKWIEEERGKPKSSILFLEGTPVPIGSTIILTGAELSELRRVKRVTQMAVMACYHQKLETAMICDEYRTAAAPMQMNDIALCSSKIKDAVERVKLRNGRVGCVSDGSSSCAPLLALSPHVVVGPIEPQVAEALTPGVALLEQQQRLTMSIYSRNILRDYVCEYPSVHKMALYGRSDITLGQFLNATMPRPGNPNRCTSPQCRMSPAAHERSYMHNSMRIDVTAFILADEKCLPGFDEGKVWTWAVFGLPERMVSSPSSPATAAVCAPADMQQHQRHKASSPFKERVPSVVVGEDAVMTFRVLVSEDALNISFLSYMLLSFMAQELVLPYEAAHRRGGQGSGESDDGDEGEHENDAKGKEALSPDDLSLHVNCNRFFGCGNSVVRFKCSRMPTYTASLPGFAGPTTQPRSTSESTWIEAEFTEVDRLVKTALPRMVAAIDALEACISRARHLLIEVHELENVGEEEHTLVDGPSTPPPSDSSLENEQQARWKRGALLLARSRSRMSPSGIKAGNDIDDDLSLLMSVKEELYTEHRSLDADLRALQPLVAEGSVSELIVRINFVRQRLAICSCRREAELKSMFRSVVEQLTTRLFPTSEVQLTASTTGGGGGSTADVKERDILHISSQRSSQQQQQQQQQRIHNPLVLNESRPNPTLTISRNLSIRRKEFDYSTVLDASDHDATTTTSSISTMTQAAAQNVASMSPQLPQVPLTEGAACDVGADAEAGTATAPPSTSADATTNLPVSISPSSSTGLPTEAAPAPSPAALTRRKTHRRTSSDPFSLMKRMNDIGKLGMTGTADTGTEGTRGRHRQRGSSSNEMASLLHDIDDGFKGLELPSESVGQCIMNDLSEEYAAPIWVSEPTSIVAHALSSPGYKSSLQKLWKSSTSGQARPEHSMNGGGEEGVGSSGDSSSASTYTSGAAAADRLCSDEDILCSREQMHVRYSFEEASDPGAVAVEYLRCDGSADCSHDERGAATTAASATTATTGSGSGSGSGIGGVTGTLDSGDMPVRYSVTAYYAPQFDAFRRIAYYGPSSRDSSEFVSSLFRCARWESCGGKSNVYFAKTKDDRFVIKQLSRSELHSFLDFAPQYFSYLSSALSRDAPTCLSKIMGVYQVTVRVRSKETRLDMYVLENLLYDRDSIKVVYDLKGSLRGRYTLPPPNCDRVVLMDENLVETNSRDPILMRCDARKRLLEALDNDTKFLSGLLVMDYSLLVGVDVRGEQLVVGIIDFLRQYTWDKQLETWVKSSGIVGGTSKGAPTVTSPVHYMERFRKQMASYFRIMPSRFDD